MNHSRQSEEIRANALPMGARMSTEGGAGAKQDFAWVQQDGPAEEGTQSAAAATANSESEHASLNRRDLLKLAAAGAAGLATSSVSGAVTTRYGTAPGVAQSAAGAQVAWVAADRSPTPPAGQPTGRLVGINEGGNIVGQIDPFPGAVVRTPDATAIVEVTPRLDATTVTAVIDVFDAASGQLLREFAGQAVALHGPQALNFDGTTPELSPDGHLLAVLHQVQGIQSGTEQQFPKVGPGGNTTTMVTTGQHVVAFAVELFDLQAGRRLDAHDLGAAPSNNLDGYSLFSPNDQSLYVFTTQNTGPQPLGNLTVTTLATAGGQLQLQTSVTNGSGGRTLPAGSVGMRPAHRFLDDGVTLVHYDAPDHVRFFDMATLTLIGDLNVGKDPPTKYAIPVGLFSSDGSTLYVVNPDLGTIRVVELSSRSVVRTATVPAPSGAVAGHKRPGAAALSPDGSRLYIVDGRSATGLTVVHLPDLQVESTWLADQNVIDVWPSPDGRTVFTLGTDRVYVSNHDGTLVASTVVGSRVLYFITPQ